MRKTALYVHRFLGLVTEVVTFFVVVFPPYPWFTGLLVMLSIAFTISFDYHLKHYLNKLSGTFNTALRYNINRTRKIIIKGAITIISCAGIWAFEFHPFYDMLWFLLLISSVKFSSSYFLLRKNAFFIVINEKEIIEYNENITSHHYPFEALASLRLKGYTLLVNMPPILPTKIDLDITERDLFDIRQHLSTHAKSIFASFLSKGN